MTSGRPDPRRPVAGAPVPRPRAEGQGEPQSTPPSHSALQAIHDRDGRTIGYELFRRDGPTAQHPSDPAIAATLETLAHRRTGREKDKKPDPHLYVVNVTRDLVAGGLRLPDPTQLAVLAVPSDVFADEGVIAGAADLRARGYGVALDHYAPQHENNHEALLPFASHVKLDLTNPDRETLTRTVRFVRDHSNAVLVGAPLETRHLVDLARSVGCTLFQGQATAPPTAGTTQALAGSLAQYVRLLVLLAPEDNRVDMREMTGAVMRDPDLSVRVLQACNSASTGINSQVTSIQQAVVMLGLSRIRRLVHLAIAKGLGVASDDQLTQMIEYATLAELVGTRLQVPPGTGFMAGLLLEVADATGMSLANLVGDLPIDPTLAADLRDRRGAVGETLSMIDAYKQANLVPDVVSLDDVHALHANAMLAATEAVRATEAASGAAPAAPPRFPPVRQPAPATGE